MASAPAGSQLLLIVDNAPTGLVGTIGARIYNATTGATVTARTTTGIVELAGTGTYIWTTTAPATPGPYLVQWDTGGATPVYATEPLTVSLATVGILEGVLVA